MGERFGKYWKEIVVEVEKPDLETGLFIYNLCENEWLETYSCG